MPINFSLIIIYGKFVSNSWQFVFKEKPEKIISVCLSMSKSAFRGKASEIDSYLFLLSSGRAAVEELMQPAAPM